MGQDGGRQNVDSGEKIQGSEERENIKKKNLGDEECEEYEKPT